MSITISGTTGIDAGSLPVNNCGNTEVEGNLNLSGVGTRITGDFSNTTVSSRVAFQTSTIDGNTIVSARPNGAGTQGMFICESTSDANNCQTMNIQATTVDTKIVSAARGTAAYVPMVFLTGGSEKMRIDTAGNVGIGTSSPATQLHLQAATQVVHRLSSGTATTDLLTTQDSNGMLRTVGAHPLVFATQNIERLRIDSAGNVGIGTSSPSFTLDIRNTKTTGTSSDNAVVQLKSSNRNTGLLFDTIGGSYSGGLSNYVNGVIKSQLLMNASGDILSILPNGGIGYGTGAGGTVTQLTSKSTSVTLNKPTGQIIMNNSVLAAGSYVIFDFVNNIVNEKDGLVLGMKYDGISAWDYSYWYVAYNGGYKISVKNNGASSRSDTLTINFQIVKGANA